MCHQRIKTHPNLIKTSRQSIIVIIVSIGFAYIIPPSQAAREKKDIIQNLSIFEQINTVALQWDKLRHQSGGNYDRYQDRLFHIAENAFKTAQGMEEKYKYATDLNSIIQEQGKLLYEHGEINNSQYALFRQLEENFNK